jgi:phosphoglycerol transferase MdoB-like AlkP superfamily enzyme
LGEEIFIIRDELGKKKGLKVPKFKSYKSKKDNDQKKKDKMTNNDLQNITKKNKDGATRTQ